MKKTDAKDAVRDSSHRYAVWARSEDRLGDECWPHISPSFVIDRGAVIFTVGSCFAHNIEKNLARLGYAVPCLDFENERSVSAEFTGRLLTKYTPAAIFQELAWAAEIFERDGVVGPDDCEHFAYEVEGGVIDNNLAGFEVVSSEDFLARRRAVYPVFASAFEADCVVMTLGLTEAWFDEERGLYIHRAPHTQRDLRRDMERFRFVELDFATSKSFIERAIDTVHRLNPDARFLITTSPVPLSRTFTAEDVIVANMQSKSVLRAVCGEVARGRDDTDYFPSFESVMLTRSWAQWGADRRHIKDDFVSRIVETLCRSYFSSSDEADRHYQASFALSEGEEGGLQEALRRVDEALATAPEDARFLLRRADLLTRLGRPEEAEGVAARVLEADAENAEAHAARGAARAARSDLSGAEHDYRAALGLSPGEIEFLHELGRVLSSAERWVEAEEVYRTLVERRPYTAGYRVSLGVALRGLARLEESAAAIQAAIFQPPQNFGAFKELGKTLAAAGRGVDAIAALETARRIRPDHEGVRAALEALRGDGKPG